jgi:PAS domain S-box-containing protein
MSEHSLDSRCSSRSIKVLHVDDDRSFAELCAESLERKNDLLTVETATSATEALEALADINPDCIVSDHEMPEVGGLEFLEKVRETRPDLPFILFTGKGSEELASEAISAGVTDYLQKSLGQDQYQILANRIENAVATYRSQRSLEVFRAAAEHSGHSIYITDTDGVIEYVNPTFTEITGYTPEEAIGQTPSILKSGEHDESFYADLWQTISDGEIWEDEIINRRKNDDLYVASQTIAPIFVRNGTPQKFVAVNQNVTDQKRHELTLEKQRDGFEILNRILRHGIRDDLQAVTGYTTLLRDHVDSEGQDHLDLIDERSWDAVDRLETARNFAEQLSRADPEDALIDLRQVVESAVWNARSLRDDIEITIDESASSASVAADTVIESIVRILTENIARSDGDRPQQVTISTSTAGDRVVIRAATESDESSGVVRELQHGGVLNLETVGKRPSELYLIQGFINGYDGRVEVTEVDSNLVAFEIEYPVQQSVTDHDVDLVHPPIE